MSSELSLDSPNESFTCFRLYLLHSLSYHFFSFIALLLLMIATYSIEYLTILRCLSLLNLSDNIVAGDFNAYHLNSFNHANVTFNFLLPSLSIKYWNSLFVSLRILINILLYMLLFLTTILILVYTCQFIRYGQQETHFTREPVG